MAAKDIRCLTSLTVTHNPCITYIAPASITVLNFSRKHDGTVVVVWQSGNTRVSQYQKGKTRKGKPIWIYWSKRQ